MVLKSHKTSIAKLVSVAALLVGLAIYLGYQTKIEGLWLVFPYAGSIRVSTVATAVVCFLLVFSE